MEAVYTWQLLPHWQPHPPRHSFLQMAISRNGAACPQILYPQNFPSTFTRCTIASAKTYTVTFQTIFGSNTTKLF